MPPAINDILKEIGWIDGLQLPVANDENKKLQNEIEEMLRHKADLIVQLDLSNENINSLNKHIKDIQSEMDLNQQLSVAHKNQFDTEYKMLKDSEFQLKKTQQEIKTMEKDIHNVYEKNSMLQAEIEHGTKKLNLLQKTIEWGEEARLAWEEDLARGERDNNLLEKYKLEDDAKFKELELKRQRLKAEVKERDNILSKEIAEISNLENQLEQISTLFRHVHDERSSLLHYWDEAVTILKQRDAKIQSVLLDIERIRNKAREMYLTLNDHRKFYETQVSNNEEIRKQVDETNQKAVLQRQVNMNVVHTTDDIRNELTSLRATLSDLGTSLNTQRSHNKQMSTEVQKKTKQYNNILSEVEELKQKLDILSNAEMTAAQHAREIEKILQATEHNKSVMLNKLGKLQNQVFEKKQELQSLKRTSASQLLELQTCVSNKQAFAKRAASIDKTFIKKEQILYELEMQLVQMEGKLAHLLGEKTGEDREQIKQKIIELEEEHKKTQDIYNMLNTQNNNSKKEHTRLTNILEEDAGMLKILTENRQSKLYLVEGAKKELNSIIQENKQLQVQNNMLKLRVEQVHKALAKEDTSVISLERQKVELETAIKERKIEITAQKEILLAKKRRLQEEKSEIVRAIEQVNIRTGQLQKKYDIIMDSLGSKDSGEDFSISRFKIQMAQEKYELQEKGDELDAKIKKSEREILAMENTLRVINASNDSYKRNLDSIDANSPEMQEKENLEVQYKALLITLHQKQADLKEVDDKIQELEDSLAELNDTEERVKGEWLERDTAAQQLDKDLVEQQTKLHRAERLLRKLVKEVQTINVPNIPLNLAEKDIEVRELQELNQSGLQQLSELATRYMETGPVLNRYLVEKNLQLPMVRCTGSTTARTKISCSTLSVNQSARSDDGRASATTYSSGPHSQTPSVINLDPSSLFSETKKKPVMKRASKSKSNLTKQ